MKVSDDTTVISWNSNNDEKMLFECVVMSQNTFLSFQVPQEMFNSKVTVEESPDSQDSLVFLAVLEVTGEVFTTIVNFICFHL